MSSVCVYVLCVCVYTHISLQFKISWASLVAQMVKNLPAGQETLVQSLGWEDPLEKGMTTSYRILARQIPQRSLAGDSPCSRKELGTAEWLTLLLSDSPYGFSTVPWGHLGTKLGPMVLSSFQASVWKLCIMFQVLLSLPLGPWRLYVPDGTTSKCWKETVEAWLGNKLLLSSITLICWALRGEHFVLQLRTIQYGSHWRPLCAGNMHSATFQGLKKRRQSEYFSTKHNFIVLVELQFTSLHCIGHCCFTIRFVQERA